MSDLTHGLWKAWDPWCSDGLLLACVKMESKSECQQLCGEERGRDNLPPPHPAFFFFFWTVIMRLEKCLPEAFYEKEHEKY